MKTRHVNHPVRAVSWLIAAGIWAAPAVAEKTDVVVLRNGDRITGEVVELTYGQLKYKTDDMGTLYIEWDKIRSLSTTQVLQVELADGARVVGQAPEAAEAPGMLVIVPTDQERGAGPLALAMTDIVRVSTLEQGAWYSRLDGSVSVGYSFTQATDIQESSFSGSVYTRTVKRKLGLDLDFNTSSQGDGPSSERAALSGRVERFLPSRYYYESTLNFSRNDELGLDLRSLLSITTGRYLVQRQGREWRAGIGLAGSREDRNDGTTVESVELPLTTTFRMFRLDSPKTDVTFELTALPSLTESGRWRGEATLKARYEVISDLFFEISLYDSYDNRPPEGFESNDWNVTTSLGYSF